MITRRQIGIILIFCMLLAAVPSVMAQKFDNIDQNIKVKDIVWNHTVFFGEEHVNITDCVRDHNSSAVYPYVVTLNVVRNVTDSIKISNPADFTLPTDKEENVWYQAIDPDTPVMINGAPVPAFTSQEAVLDFDVWNVDTNTKVADSANVARGNLLGFKYTVATNLDDIATRYDYKKDTGYISMGVVAPDGNQILKLTTLNRASGVTSQVSTTNLNVNPSPGWTWPNVAGTGWWTGWRDQMTDPESGFLYSTGNYSVVGLCNVNNMFKNQQNKGVTWQEKKFNIVPMPLSISTTTPAAGRDQQFTATITGQPSYSYQLFIYDQCPPKLTGEICSRPPYITGDRAELQKEKIILDPENGPYASPYIGNTPVVDCCVNETTIREVVPSGDAYPSKGHNVFEKGTRYYANVTTGLDGTATVPFWIDTYVNAGSYTIQVQDNFNKQKADANVTVSKGAITAATKSDSGEAKSTFYVGDEIWLEGTNTDTNMTYIWLTGPGLDPCGVNLRTPSSSDPEQAVVYDQKVINGQTLTNYWRIDPNWQTINTPLAPGNYTLWFSSIPSAGRFTACYSNGTCSTTGVTSLKGICELQNCPECGVLTSVPIVLQETALTAEVKNVTPCCCPGSCAILGGVEKFYVNGTAGGNNCKKLHMWLFGQSQFGTKNYLFNETDTYCDDSYQFELNNGLLKPNNISLCQLPTGTYDLVVQAPGDNGKFDIRPGDTESNGDRYVYTTVPTADSKLFLIEGKTAAYGQIALKSLVEGFNKPGIDDKYVHVQFSVNQKKCEGTVDFSADRNSGNSPLTVQFTDKSVMKGVNWSWYANDVLFSTEQNPKYTFNDSIKYTIKMVVTDAEGQSNTATKDGFINVVSAPVADFSFNPQSPGIKEQIQFTDQSTGSPTSWMWDFGDGNTSSLQSPAHAYNAAGTYDVTLTVSNALGIGAPVKKAITVVHDKPVANFSATPTFYQYIPAEITFTDSSTGTISSWYWNITTLGKTVATSADKNPVITFTEAGIYNVSLTVSNNGGSDTMTKAGYITVGTGSTIYLSPGWNHVSVPKAVTSDYNTLEKLFAGVDRGGVDFAVYNTKVNNWTTVATNYSVNPLETFRVNYVSGPTEIHPVYVDGGNFTRNLAAGWNGIGIMAMQPTKASTALASLGTAWNKTLMFNPTTQRWEEPIIRGVNDDEEMSPTVGYLIEMNTNGTLIGSGV